MPHEPNKCSCSNRALFRPQFFIRHLIISLLAITVNGNGRVIDQHLHRHHHQQHPHPHHQQQQLVSSSSSSSSSSVKCPQPSVNHWMDSGSKAYISPIVFTGKLISLSEDYSGRVAASFRVLKTIKNIGSSHGQVPVNPLPGSHVVLYFVTKKDISWRPTPPHCAIHLSDSQVAELRPVSKYIVYASSPLISLVNLHKNSPTGHQQQQQQSPSSEHNHVNQVNSYTYDSNNNKTVSSHTYTSYLTAYAPPDVLSKRATRSMRRVLCPQCALAPEVSLKEVASKRDLRVESLANLRLTCKVIGNPSPLVQWFRNGKPLYNKGRVSIQHKRKSSVLQIRKVHASTDTGYYECHAINPLSTSLARVRVIVTRPLKESPVDPPSSSSASTSQSSPLLPSETLPSTITTTTTRTTTTATTAIPLAGAGPTAETREKMPRAPSDWSVCPTTDFCLNGGQCSFIESIGEYVCQCADGYKGMRCEMKDLFAS